MPDLTFERVRSDDEPQLRAWFDIVHAVHRADRPDDPPPSPVQWIGSLTHPQPGHDPRVFLARAGADVVGWFALYLMTTENLDTAPLELEVHPAHRRQGYGRAILDEALGRTKELGRTRVVAEAVTDSAGAALAAAAGAKSVLADTQRKLEIAGLDDARLDELLADAREHSAGYSLVQWIGATPDAHLGAIAALESRMTTDAPFDDLAWEQEVFDDDRIRARDAAKSAHGLRSYSTAAVHDASGTVVGYTCVVVPADVDEGADQWQTIVLPEHRGHRLGTLLKITNLRFLLRHEPGVRRVDTWNADSNAPMLRVNMALGFQVVRQWAEWELVL